MNSNTPMMLIRKLREWMQNTKRSLNLSSDRKDNALVPRESVVMHVDIVGSTQLVSRDLVSAHITMQLLYSRICREAERLGGRALELRGDAAVIEFDKPCHAVTAAQAIQSMSYLAKNSRIRLMEPQLRIGIAQGSIIVCNNTVTGDAVILAQRLEQIASPGEILVDEKIGALLSGESEFTLSSSGETQLKGFSYAMEVFRAVFNPVVAGTYNPTS